MINFESEKRNERNTEKSESIFFANDRTCFNFHMRRLIAKSCRAKQQKPNHKKSKLKLTFFRCTKVGHNAKKCSTNKKFESHDIKMV